MSDWRLTIETKSGIDAAHKGLKIFRAFWRVMQALRSTQLSDPSLKVTNTAPEPRDQQFSYGEAIRLAKTAWREGYRGLAYIIMTAWDTGFSPKDARTAQKRHIGEDAVTHRYIIDRTAGGRAKTGVAVIGTLSKFGDWLVRRCFEELGADLLEDAFLSNAARRPLWRKPIGKRFRDDPRNRPARR